MPEVSLFKKNVSYTDKNGQERKGVNFYLKCGDSLVPIDVKFFEDKETGLDNQFRSRRSILSAFASILPDKK